MNSEKFRHLGRVKSPKSGKGFSGVLFMFVVLIAGLLLIKSSYFTVGTVVVEGNKYLAVEEVYRIADIPEAVNIFSLNTTTIKKRLMSDLRVAETDVSRRFPGTIVIQVKERSPIAYMASPYGFVELDKQGVVLAVFKNLKQVNVPMITGTRLENQYVGDQLSSPVIKNIIAYLAQVDETTLNQLSEINIKPSGEIVAYTINSVSIRLGNNEHLAEKAKLTNEILEEMSKKKRVIEYIDLNSASPVIKLKQ